MDDTKKNDATLWTNAFLSSKQIYLPRKRLENTKIGCVNYIGDEEDDDGGVDRWYY